MASLSPSGKNQLQQEVQTLSVGFAGLTAQIDSSLSSSNTCLITWDEFDKEFNDFTQWIASMSQNLHNKQTSKSGAEEKKANFEELQVSIINVYNYFQMLFVIVLLISKGIYICFSYLCLVYMY